MSTAGLQPSMSGGTAVTVLATSTANDQLAAFNVEFENVTLTSKSGKTVSLISSPVTSEFLHLNGSVEPLVSVNVPQDVYTAVNVTLGSAWFTCTDYLPSTGFQNTTFEDLQVPSSDVTVTLPAPITVTGTSIGIKFDLKVSQSATYSACQSGSNTTFAITPNFTVTPLTIATNPTNSENGKAEDLHGLISSVNANEGSFSVAGADGVDLYGPSWQFNTSGKTQFQQVGGITGLATGMPVDIDAVIQPDGTLLATRVAVYDTDKTNLNIFTGPINTSSNSPQSFSIIGQEQEGYLDKSSYYVGAFPVSYGNARFQISGAFTNLQGLPFSAVFGAGNMVAGQSFSVTTHVSSVSGSSLPVSTVTLMPQTINGTVSSVSSDGAFTTYTITLAAYDKLSNLEAQSATTGAGISNPSTVVVYADENTQGLNGAPIAVGGLFRFNGLVFNDHGTLRMDCAQIRDGVAN